MPASGFRAFLILWCGQFVSLTGSALSGFALGVYVYQRTGSATAFGLLLAFATLPFILASPFTGSLVDRWGARRALLVGNVGDLFVMLVLAVLLLRHAATPWLIGVVVGCLSVFSALAGPAFEAALPLLVAKRDIGRANGMRLVALATSQVLAPVTAGFLLLAIGIYGIVLMDCATFGLGLLSLLWVRIPRAPREPGEASSRLLTDFRLAWRYVTLRRGLLILLVFMAALEFCASVVDLLITPLILAFGSSGTLGTVLSIGGTGMIATSLVMTAWGGPRRRVPGVLGFALLMAGSAVLGSLRPNVVLIAVAAFLFLGGLAIVIGSNRSLWQTKVPPQLLGRAMALQNMLASVSQLLAYALAGVLAEQLFLPLAGRHQVRSAALATVIGTGPGRGYALLMMVMGLLLGLCAVLGYLHPRLRHLEDELPDMAADAESTEPDATTPARV